MDRRGQDRDPPILKVAGPGDAERVTDLLRASYPVLWQGVYEKRILDAVLPLFCQAQDELLKAGTFYLVKTAVSGRFLGVGGWARRRGGCKSVVPGEGHVRHFAVHPDAQRRGIGRLLMNAVLAAAASNGVDTLHCTSSLSAGAYYEAFGFRETGRVTIPIAGVDLPVIEMRRDA